MTSPPQDPEQARALARIEQALTSLGSEHAPPLGWEARVLAARQPQARTHWSWLRWLVPAVAVATAVLLWLVLRPPGPPALELAMTIEATGPKVRAAPEEVQLGDTIHARAIGGRHRALWLYFENKLVVACPGHPRCELGAARLELAWIPDTLGRYALIALYSNEPLAAPRGELDVDVSAARRAGAELRDRRFEIR